MAQASTPMSASLPKFQFRQTIGDKERRFFTEQMSLLLETGTPLQASLQAMKKQVDNPAMLELLDQLIDDIGQGVQFSTALAKHPAIFSTTYTNLVAASEEGGFMHEVLEQLLHMDEKREQLRSTLVSAATYPMFLIAFSVAVVVFVLVVVLCRRSIFFF